MTAVLIALGVAAAALVRAIMLLVYERRLRRRLRPIRARIMDPGLRGEINASDQAWADAQNARRDRAMAAGREPESALPTAAPSPVFVATWEFDLEGRTYRGTGKSNGPVFSPEQARAKQAEIWFDPADPAVSMVRPGANDEAWAWFIAAGVVAAVATAIFLIARPDLAA